MSFKTVKVFNFRNLSNSSINFSDKDIYLVGENGQGKTNFLESIYLLCVGSSFRTKNENMFIKSGQKSMSVSGEYVDKGTFRKILLKIEGGRKSISVDGVRLKDRKELIADFPCIVFSHDDINVVNGAPEKRRIFMNQTISLYDSEYIDSLRLYNRVLKIRNRVLKEKRIDLIDLYDNQLAEAGIVIQKKRIQLINDFNSTFSFLYRTIASADIDLKIRYSSSWKNKPEQEEILTELKEHRKKDIDYALTTSGPHRDRIGFYSGNHNFASTASTGQVRLISLSLKASQAVFFSVKTGKQPILLLDDVLLELDLQKRKRFLENLPDYKQAFFTFLPDEGLVDYKKSGHLHRVSNGNIELEEV